MLLIYLLILPFISHCAATVAKDFVGGTQLKTTGGKTEEVKTAKPLPTGVAVANSAAANAAKVAPAVTTPDDEEDTVLLPGEKDVQPVGALACVFQRERHLRANVPQNGVNEVI